MKTKTLLTLSLAVMMAITAISPRKANASLIPAIPDAVFSTLFGITLVTWVVGDVAQEGGLSEPSSAKKINDAIGKFLPEQDTLTGTIFVNTAVFALLLDDSGNAKVALTPASEEAAKKAHLTSSEIQAYNSELEVTQQIFDQVSAEISAMPKAEQTAAAKSLWQGYRSAMSDNCFSALQKLTAAQLQ